MLDMSGIERSLLDDVVSLARGLRRVVEDAGATVVSARVDLFEPEGATITLVLAESLAAIHTYPEFGACMIDVFTCGDIDPRATIEPLRDLLKPGRSHEQVVMRGIASRRR